MIVVLSIWQPPEEWSDEFIIDNASAIDQVIIDQTVEVESNDLHGSKEGIAHSVDLCYSLDIPVTVLTASTTFNPTLINWDTAKCKTIDYPAYWIARSHDYTIAAHKRVGIDASNGFRDKINTCKYTFITMNNISKFHRCVCMDMLAKHDLMKHGAISWRQVKSHNGILVDGFLEEYKDFFTHQYKYWTPERLLLDDTPDEIVKYPNNELVPKEYFESFMQIVTETDDTLFFVSEKTATPLMFHKIFLVASSKDYHKKLKSMGFELFEELFDYSFDSIEDVATRYDMMVDNINRYKDKTPEELQQLEQSVRWKLEHNRKLAVDYATDLIPEELLDIAKLLMRENIPSQLELLVRNKERNK